MARDAAGTVKVWLLDLSRTSERKEILGRCASVEAARGTPTGGSGLAPCA